MTRTCHTCEHLSLCVFYRAVDHAIRDTNLHMVDVNQPSSSPTSFIRVFETIAVVCTQYKATP
ncbi:MAG: hypothetical protein OEW90_01855 [Betaproteobacteria bacterium]|nr:hypothetical protein [Betaproteobacteria bacterium]MDH4322864.1 hypothetical protein [Betaproteobacteria bacterium]MDH5210092.1 hypothetical protein [Betaproteobacteria bacterium]